MTYNYLYDFSIGSVLEAYVNGLFDVDWAKGFGCPDTLEWVTVDTDWDDDDILNYAITTCLTSH